SMDRAHEPRPLVRALRPLLRKAAASGAAIGSGQPKASASGPRKRRASGQKLPSSTRRKKRQRRSHGRASRPNLFHRMGGLRKENDGPNVFGCGRSVPGIDFVAASGFNDVSSTGILTYS